MEGFGGFGAFEGSIWQFRASRKGQTWPATAHIVWQLQEPVWQVSWQHQKPVCKVKCLKGASGSFGPVKKERLGLPQLAAPRAGLEGFGGFEAFEKGASGSFGPVKKEGLGLPQLAAPRAGLEVSEDLERLFMKGASGSFGPVTTERLGLPQLAAPRAGFAGFGGLPQLAAPRADWEGFARFEAFEGSIRQFRAREKKSFGLPQPIVWQLQEPVWKVSEGLKRLKREHPAVSGQ